MENNNLNNGNSVKEVPNSLDGITAKWCERALRKDGIIVPTTTVSSSEVKRLVNSETGALDGGGMTSTQMVRINLTYEGNTSDCQPPISIIAEHLNSGKCMMTGEFVF